MKRWNLFTILLIAVLLTVSCKNKKVTKGYQTIKSNEKTDSHKDVEERTKYPSVAGSFYPKEASRLREMVTKFIEEGSHRLNRKIEGKIFGIMVPHAGYRYSGPVAGVGYSILKGKKYKRVVVMAPSHYVALNVISVLDKDYYQIPTGRIKIDRYATRNLLKDPDFVYSEATFSREHALEVQLPFLQEVLGKDFELVAVILPTRNRAILDRAAMKLFSKLWNDDTLFIASSDMSHYYTYEKAISMDKETLSLIKKMDYETLIRESSRSKYELCGLSAVYVLMKMFNMVGGGKVKVLDYRNSGDTTGQKDRVVGYGAVAFVLKNSESKKSGLIEYNPEFKLTLEQKRILMEIAKRSVEVIVKEGKKYEPEVDDPYLKKKGAAFVTLKKGGRLRGCIGHIVAREPLYLTVRDMAIAAATQDPRFSPVKEFELPQLEYEISVLSPLEVVHDIKNIVVGRDGLIMERGLRRGVLLPQVSIEFGWDRETFLRHTCRKAFMEDDCYKSKETKIYRFGAIVFNEKDINLVQ